MKGKKDGIIWSIGLIVFSVIIFFILQFHLYTDGFRNVMSKILPFGLSEWREFFMVIMSGILTSSFVTLIMNCVDYKNEKRDALVNYFLVSHDFLRNFQNIEYLHFKEDFNLIRSYLAERSSNEMLKQAGLNKGLKYEAKLALQEWIWENESKETRKYLRKTKQKYLSDRLESIISEYVQQMEKIMEQYIRLSELKYREVEDAYRRIDFLCTNKKDKKGFIYKYLHERQRNLLNRIKSESYHFKNHYGKINVVNMLDILLNLQNEIFMAVDKRYGKSIYNQYCYEITCNLEFLLQITYRKRYEANYPQQREFLKCSYVDIRKLENEQDMGNQSIS